MADRLAGPALDAQVPVLRDRGAYRDPALVDGLHQRDAAPRRLRLQPRLDVRRTRLQAESAVDALVQVGLRGSVRPREQLQRVQVGRGPRHMFPADRPGFSMPPGSYWLFRPSTRGPARLSRPRRRFRPWRPTVPARRRGGRRPVRRGVCIRSSMPGIGARTLPSPSHEARDRAVGRVRHDCRIEAVRMVDALYPLDEGRDG